MLELAYGFLFRLCVIVGICFLLLLYCYASTGTFDSENIPSGVLYVVRFIIVVRSDGCACREVGKGCSVRASVRRKQHVRGVLCILVRLPIETSRSAYPPVIIVGGECEAAVV